MRSITFRILAAAIVAASFVHPSTALAQPETGEAPAGMIDVIYHPGNSTVVIQGDNHDNHARVEYVRAADTSTGYQVEVSSESGPIRYLNSFSGETVITEEPIVLPARYFNASLFIETGNGDDAIEVIGTARPNSNAFLEWGYVSIISGNGDDRVLLDDVLAPLSVSTGTGADLVTLRECGGQIINIEYSHAYVETGSGDDRVAMQGNNRFFSFSVGLGAGDDVLEGDTMTQVPVDTHLEVDAGGGFDRLLNADYFRVDERSWAFAWFEEIS